MVLFEFGRHSVLLLYMGSIFLVVVVTLPIALGAEELAITAKATKCGILVAYIAPGKLLGGFLIWSRKCAHSQLIIQRISCRRQL